MSNYPDVEQKLAAARTRLILDKPFLGALVLRLPMVPGDPKWCESTFSDGKSFYYNPDYIDALDADQTQFALSHEALHCALSHFHRRGHRVKMRWDLACDYAVNPLLINDGLKPTPDAMHLREYEGMTAEEIYPCLEDNDNGGERDLENKKNQKTLITMTSNRNRTIAAVVIKTRRKITNSLKARVSRIKIRMMRGKVVCLLNRLVCQHRKKMN